MTVLYPNPCYDEVCYKGTPLCYHYPIHVYLHFHWQSLIELLHLRCPSYLHEHNYLSHAHIHAILADQHHTHPIKLFVY